MADSADERKALEVTIERLFQTFARYRLRDRIDGCPHCNHEGAFGSVLHVKPLRELTSGDLFQFIWSALTTWGDEDDFRHFLPRMLELLAWRDGLSDGWIIADKLNYGKWRGWPIEEQESLKQFSRAFSSFCLATTPDWTDDADHLDALVDGT